MLELGFLNPLSLAIKQISYSIKLYSSIYNSTLNHKIMETNQQSSEIIEASSLLELAEVLGFIETQKMKGLQAQIINGLRDGNPISNIAHKYDLEALDNGLIKGCKGDIALMIMKALMFKVAQKNEWFKCEVAAAIDYANNASASYPQFEEIKEAIKRLTE